MCACAVYAVFFAVVDEDERREEDEEKREIKKFRGLYTSEEGEVGIKSLENENSFDFPPRKTNKNTASSL